MFLCGTLAVQCNSGGFAGFGKGADEKDLEKISMIILFLQVLVTLAMLGMLCYRLYGVVSAVIRKLVEWRSGAEAQSESMWESERVGTLDALLHGTGRVKDLSGVLSKLDSLELIRLSTSL